MAKLWTIIVALTCLLCVDQGVSAQCVGCAAGSGSIRVVRVPSAFGIPGGGAPEDLLCTSAASDLTVNLDDWTWSNDDWVLHIFDCTSGTVTQDIGKITIVGNPASITSFSVLVAHGSQTWRTDPEAALDPGCVNFSGLEVADPDLLAKTRCSVAIYGDLTQVASEPAGLHANQFVRVQVTGLTANGITTGGSINGSIIAEGSTTGGIDTNAIGHVRAWKAIHGRVEALQSSIGTVRVVGDPEGTPAPEGISGDILAEKGYIKTIFSSGQVASKSQGGL